MLKTAYLNRQKDNTSLSGYALRKAAVEKEKAGDLPAAITLYQECTRQMPKNEFGYNRLMIVYRKQREYKKEAVLIKKAIKIFEELYKPKRMVSRMVATLSKRIIKATGLADEKGHHYFDMGPLGKWRKRLQYLNKRLYK